MTRLLPAASVILACLLLAGCGRETAAPPASGSGAEAAHAGDIGWFGGTVDEAFAHARINDKPIFLLLGRRLVPALQRDQGDRIQES